MPGRVLVHGFTPALSRTGLVPARPTHRARWFHRSWVHARWLEAAGRRRCPFIKLPLPGKVGRAFKAGRSVPAAGELGSRTWRSWLAGRYRPPVQD